MRTWQTWMLVLLSVIATGCPVGPIVTPRLGSPPPSASAEQLQKEGQVTPPRVSIPLFTCSQATFSLPPEQMAALIARTVRQQGWQATPMKVFLTGRWVVRITRSFLLDVLLGPPLDVLIFETDTGGSKLNVGFGCFPEDLLPFLRANVLAYLTGQPLPAGPPPVLPGPVQLADYTPVTDPTKRLVFQGFSILPPQGADWFMGRSTLPDGTQAVSFGKKMRETACQRPEDCTTVEASVMVKNVTVPFQTRADILQYIEQAGREEAEKGTRMRLLEFKTAVDYTLGVECLRQDAILEDRGVPQFPGTVFIMTSHGLFCPHPDSPRYVIGVGYSHRTVQGQQPPSIEAEIEPFLYSLEFLRAEKPGVEITIP